MKNALKNLVVSTGADRLLRLGYGGLGSILMFHRIQPACALSRLGASSLGDVSPEDFSRMIGFLRENDIDIVSLDEALRRIGSSARCRQFVCLTFDDGYKDNYEILWPIVRKHRIPVTIYVTSGFIDRTAAMWWYGLDRLIADNDAVTLRFAEGDCTMASTTPEEKLAAFAAFRERLVTASQPSRAAAIASMTERYGLDFARLADSAAMTWEMVRELAASDLVEVAAHTVNHPPLASLDPASALREIRDSKERLEAETGKPVRHFAFPYGDELTTGAREIELAAQSGFASATTTRQGALFPAHAQSPHALPRFSMGAGDCTVSLRIKLSGLPVALRRPFRPRVMEPAE